jgi:DNA-binding response OmpR family regulator
LDGVARILVVEDDRNYSAMVAAALRLVGHVVIEAGNGREAMDHMQAEASELVITDLVMPESEGVGLIAQIRKEFRGVKIIAITGGKHPDVYLRIAAMLGADVTLAKPFPLTDLLGAVERLLKPTTDN